MDSTLFFGVIPLLLSIVAIVLSGTSIYFQFLKKSKLLISKQIIANEGMTKKRVRSKGFLTFTNLGNSSITLLNHLSFPMIKDTAIVPMMTPYKIKKPRHIKPGEPTEINFKVDIKTKLYKDKKEIRFPIELEGNKSISFLWDSTTKVTEYKSVKAKNKLSNVALRIAYIIGKDRKKEYIKLLFDGASHTFFE